MGLLPGVHAPTADTVSAVISTRTLGRTAFSQMVRLPAWLIPTGRFAGEATGRSGIWEANAHHPTGL
jgi:hypothetical protein